MERVVRSWRSCPFDRRRVKFGWTAPHPTIYLGRAVYAKHGFFDPSFRIAGDYDFLLRSQQKLIARYMNKVVARMTNDGVSNTQIAIALQETKTAKIHSGSRAQWLCEIDIIWSKIKYGLRVVSNNYINLFTRILFRSSRG